MKLVKERMYNHLMSIFTELNYKISGIILNLLFMIGSGSYTFITPECKPVPVTEENPVSRTSQLIICIATVLGEKLIDKAK